MCARSRRRGEATADKRLKRPLCAVANVRRGPRDARPGAKARETERDARATLKTKRDSRLVQSCGRHGGRTDLDAAGDPGRRRTLDCDLCSDTRSRDLATRRPSPAKHTSHHCLAEPTAARARRSRPCTARYSIPEIEPPCRNDAMRVPVSPQPRTRTLAERNARGHTLLFNLISPRLPVLNDSRPPSREAP